MRDVTSAPHDPPAAGAPAAGPAAASTASPNLSETGLARRCRAAGLKATWQRVAILRALLSTTAHPTPEDVFRALEEEGRPVSLATVYKTLDALQAAGLIHEIARPADAKRYDANLAPHHHLICTQCQRIVDYTDQALSALQPAARIDGFVPRALRVQILGTCARCAASAES